MFAVVLTGPPGAGKTSVLTALVDALSDDDIAHAAIEVEMLVWTHPALTDEQWARHLRMACELYREAGHRLLLVAQTLETDADIAELLDAVGAGQTFLVRLVKLVPVCSAAVGGSAVAWASACPARCGGGGWAWPGESPAVGRTHAPNCRPVGLAARRPRSGGRPCPPTRQPCRVIDGAASPTSIVHTLALRRRTAPARVIAVMSMTDGRRDGKNPKVTCGNDPLFVCRGSQTILARCPLEYPLAD